jgi:hypothetical protein
MAENSEVLDFLRARFARQDERFDRVERKLDEVITRLAAVERDVTGLHGDFAALKIGFASMQSRLDSWTGVSSALSAGSSSSRCGKAGVLASLLGSIDRGLLDTLQPKGVGVPARVEATGA